MKASRAPGPISYTQLHKQTPNSAGAGRPVVGKTNVDKTGGNKKSAAQDQQVGKLMKYIDLDDIPDLADGWGNADPSPNFNNPPRNNNTQQQPSTHSSYQQQAAKRTTDNSYQTQPANVSYKIKEVHYDDYQDEDSPRGGYQPPRQPLSADYNLPHHGHGNTIHRSIYGNATAPTSSSAWEQPPDDDYIEEEEDIRVQSNTKFNQRNQQGTSQLNSPMKKVAISAKGHPPQQKHYSYHHDDDDDDEIPDEDDGYYKNQQHNHNNHTQNRPNYDQYDQGGYSDDEDDNGYAKKGPVKAGNSSKAPAGSKPTANNKPVQKRNETVVMQKADAKGKVHFTESTNDQDAKAGKPAAAAKKQPSVAFGAGNAPPPLPCDMKKAEKSYEDMTEDEKLYFAKQPRQVEFKPYTLNQYKLIKPKEYVEIGKLKPDLNTDELVAKRKNVERIKEFSKQLRHFNQEVLVQQPKLPPSTEQVEIEKSKSKLESSRQKAMDYARNVPKPKLTSVEPVPQGTRQSRSAGDNGAEYGGRGQGMLYMDEDAFEAAKLQELESKHLQNKAKMEAIRKSIR